MAKKKTLKRQKESLISSKKIKYIKHNTSNSGFKDTALVKEILIESLMNDDIESFKDVLVAYLRVASKTKLVNETRIGRQTLYDLINEEKDFNPRLKTLSSILKTIAA